MPLQLLARHLLALLTLVLKTQGNASLSIISLADDREEEAL